ncbi:MAG TPA: M13 family metallopeptidase [Allosphingosinicella sp.]|nr:M13 family metallopeptidase [Allosphingosinicella sp.]
MPSRKFLLVASLLLAGAAPVIAGAAQPARPAAGKAQYGSFGIDLAARDMAVKPGDDFFRYANGTWLRATQIPADRTSWSLWTVLSEDIERQVRAIVTEGATSRDPGQRKVADFYAAWMDEAGIERRGTAPLQPYLQRIAAIRDRAGLLAVFATPGYQSPVGVGIIPDLANPTRYTAIAGQGGLGMPNRDYYLREGEQFDRYRAAYRNYVIQLHRLAGIADPEARADRIIALERRIAEAHWTPERSRDIQAINNPMNRAQLAQLAPQFDWPNYLQRRGLGNVDIVIATQTTAITGIGRLLDEVPLDTWKDYLTFHFINSYAQYLPRAFDEAKFDFFNRTLGGQQQQRERWKRGLGYVNASMGEAVGKIYIERHFPAESRRQMTELIGNLRAAFAERLRNLEWMDDATRQAALAKLDAFEPRIGGPAVWIDYTNYRVDRNDLLGNMVRAAEFNWNLQLSRLPNPVDRRLWGMNAHIINASYNPLQNQITFPAGILQPPFFDPNADPAVNYGAIGAVIGHEIGHGFDDQGRRFDPQGRVRDWWSATSGQRFMERAARLGAQYSSYRPLPDLAVNGQLTMGENIGDLGGLEMAYAAYRRHVAQHGEPPVIDGLTGDQRFFLSWAQVWRSLDREGLARQRILTDPHSPEEFRVNGAVRNIDAWYRAFNVQPGDRLYLPPEQRVHIW